MPSETSLIVSKFKSLGDKYPVTLVDNSHYLLPVKLPAALLLSYPYKVLVNYRSTIAVNIGVSELISMPGNRLCIGIAPKFAEKGLILLTSPPWLDNVSKVILVGHIGREIIEINEGDQLFVCWRESSLNFV